MSDPDSVVLLHGIGRTDRSMARLEKSFTAAGYRALNIDYPSRKYSLADLAEYIHPKIAAFHTSGKLHFIGHSMGGLLIRTYIAKYAPKDLGRIVMIGTPNNGSEVADFLGNFWLFRKFYGPAGQELKTTHSRAGLGALPAETGVIAGNRKIDPVCGFIIPGENDGKVSVRSTYALGLQDHIVLPVTHSFMQQNPETVRQAVYFIGNGKFDVKS